MNPKVVGVLVLFLLLIVAGITIGFLMMKPKSVQATASRTPTPVVPPTPSASVGSGEGVSASGSGSGSGEGVSASGSGSGSGEGVSASGSGSGSGEGVSASGSGSGSGKGVSASGSGSGSGKGVSASGSGSGSGKPEPKNVSTKKARFLLTTRYTKVGCEGKVVSDLTMNPGTKLGAVINQSLPEGQYACCAQIENMKIDNLDATVGKKSHLVMKDMDIQNKTVIDLTHNEKISGGTRTMCADKFDGTFRISQ